MKSIHLCLLLVLISFAQASRSSGQNSQILTRGHVASVPVDSSHDSSPAHMLERNDLAVSEPSAFPSLLPNRDQGGSDDGVASRENDKSGLASPAITVTFSLAVVLGLFAGLVWVTRKFGSRNLAQGMIPKEVLQGLGSTPIDARTRITLVRCGNRILVMAQTATNVQPLSEITDPDEVRDLTAACIGDSKQAFASALRSIEKEKSSRGYVEGQTNPPKTQDRGPRDRGRLFATA